MQYRIVSLMLFVVFFVLSSTSIFANSSSDDLAKDVLTIKNIFDAENFDVEMTPIDTQKLLTDFSTADGRIHMHQFFADLYPQEFSTINDPEGKKFDKFSNDLIHLYQAFALMYKKKNGHFDKLKKLYGRIIVQLNPFAGKRGQVSEEDTRELMFLNKERSEIHYVLRGLIRDYEKFLHNQEKSYYVQKDLNDSDGDMQIMKAFIAANARLMINDLYYAGWFRYYEIANIRRILDFIANREKEEAFSLIAQRYYSIRNMFEVNRAVKITRMILSRTRKNTAPERRLFLGLTSSEPNMVIISLLRSILSSDTFSDERRDKIKSNAIKYLTLFHKKTKYVLRPSLRDMNRTIWEEIKGDFTFSFGNSVGSFRWQKGAMYPLRKDYAKIIEPQLMPLDVLLEKTPKVTSSMIGPFGHAAIWLGTEKQWRELGIYPQIEAAFKDWYTRSKKKAVSKEDKKRINDILQKVKADSPFHDGHYYIAEAIKPGVTLNNLNHFLDIDDLLVLRSQRLESIRQMNSEEYKGRVLKAVLFAIEQLGKHYNYAFNSDDQNKLYCSELVWKTLSEVQLIEQHDLTGQSIFDGSWTIKPEHFASKENLRHLFTAEVFYRKGVEVNVHDKKELRKNLEEQLDLQKKEQDKVDENIDLDPYLIKERAQKFFKDVGNVLNGSNKKHSSNHRP